MEKIMGSKPMPIVILLVEDDIDDVRLTCKALTGRNPLLDIYDVQDGIEHCSC
jgi:hypothetical protein